MGKEELVRPRDVQRMLRLLRELTELPTGTGEREAHLLRGLSDLLGAPFAQLYHVDDFILGRLPMKSLAGYEVGMDASQQEMLLDYLRQTGADDPLFEPLARHLRRCAPGEVLVASRRDVLPDRDWYLDEHVLNIRKPVDLDHCLFGNLQVDGRGRVAVLSLHRPWGERPFGERERQLVSLFWAEAARLVPYDPLAVGGMRRDRDTGEVDFARPLAPRLRQVLDGLLHGQSAKEIGQALALSVNTVNGYVRSLHRLFGTSSHAELIARCSGRHEV